MVTYSEVPVLQVLDILRARGHFYKFLHLLFSKPMHRDLFFEVRGGGNVEELKEIGQGGALLYEFFQLGEVEGIDRELEEYHRLFLGPGPLPAPPWESFYRSKEQLLFDKPMFEIREQFNKFGLKFIKENNEPDDHLVLELEFMIHLIDKSIESIESESFSTYLDAQTNLIESHFCHWIPAYCERMLKGTDSKLYRGAALLLQDFIQLDGDSLKEIKEVL